MLKFKKGDLVRINYQPGMDTCGIREDFLKDKTESKQVYEVTYTGDGNWIELKGGGFAFMPHLLVPAVDDPAQLFELLVNGKINEKYYEKLTRS